MHIKHQNHQLPLRPRHLAGVAGAAALGAAGVLVGAAAYATARINNRQPGDFMSAYTFSPFETRVEGYEEITFRTPPTACA